MGIKSFTYNIYDTKYKTLVVLTLIMFAVALVFLGYKYATTGEFIAKGVSLKGGITVTIPIDKEIDHLALQEKLAEGFDKAEIGVRTVTEAGRTKAIIIEASDIEPAELENAIRQAGIELIEDKYTIESMGSALGTQFFRQTLTALVIAFIGIGVVIFVTFKKTVPSLFIILAAASDMICTLAVISGIGVKLSTAGVASFLMLIGYAADANILLTTRVLRRKEGTALSRTIDALKTGLTMTTTTLAAATVAYIFSTSDVIKQIMLILIVGIVFDMINAWIQNAGILRWYIERKNAKQEENQN